MAKVKVQDNGKAPSGLSTGDQVVTGGGTYKITGVNSDGTYKSEKVSNETTSTYKGSYDSPGGGNGSTSNNSSQGYVSSGGGGGSSRNTSPTVANAASAVRTANAVNTATGITEGYRPTGTYNDAGLRASGGGAVDPITQYKIAYEAAKARGDQAGMEQAHQAAEQYRAQFGYSGGSDGSENIASPIAGIGGMAGGAVPVASWDGSTAVSADGEAYTIGSFLGKNFLFNGENGETMTGGDGSVWKKDANGMVTITKNGKTYTVQGTPNEPLQEWQMPDFQMPEAFEAGEFSYTPFEQTAMGRQALADYQKLLNEVNNYKAFSYDKDTDPLYKQYADSYTRSGQRAMNDVMGQLAARTGGMASSYAGAMAQQTYDQYMADLANKVPELQQLAYSMYMDDYNKLLGRYDRGYQRYAEDYNRYMDKQRLDQSTWATKAGLDQSTWATMANMAMNQWQTEAQLGLDKYQTDVQNRQWDRANMQDVLRSDFDYKNQDRSFDYGKAQDQKQWDWQQTQFDYQKEQDAFNRQMAEREYADAQKSDLYNRISNGYMPTDEDAARYGISQTELDSLRKWVNNQWGAQSDKWWAY